MQRGGGGRGGRGKERGEEVGSGEIGRGGREVGWGKGCCGSGIRREVGG